MRGFLLGCGALVVAVLVYVIGGKAVEEAGGVSSQDEVPRLDPFPSARPRLPAVGGVVEDDRGPLGDAVVVLSPQDGGRTVTAITDATGTWDLEVEPGRYRLTVSRAEYLPLAETVALPADNLVSHLTRGGELVTGTVTDMFGAPIADARVELFDGDGPPLGITVSRDQGAFSISLARRYGSARASHDNYVSNGERYTSGPLVLRLWPGVRIQGAVVREDGEPCPNADVTFEVETAHRTGKRSTTRADVDGQFSVTVALGQATIRAVGPGCVSRSPVLTTIDAPRSVRIVTERGYQLAGRVIDRESKQPIAGAKVDLAFEVSHSQPGAITDKDGMFWFSGVLPDKVKLLVEHADHLREIGEPFDFTADHAVVIALERGRMLRGRVEPPAIAELQLVPESVTNDISTSRAFDVKGRSNADGSFVLSRVPDGKHQLLAQTADGSTGRLVLEVSRDRDDVRIQLRVDGTAALVGRVIDDANRPVADHEVVVSSDWSERRRVRTDTDGGFRIERLAAGEADIHVIGRDRLDDQRVVLGTSTTQVTLVVRRTDVVFRGRVVDDKGPVAGIWVSAVKVSQPVFHTEVLTASDGSFEITGLPNEPHDLRAESPTGDLGGDASAIEPGATTVIRVERRAAVTVAVTRRGKPVRAFAVSCQRGQEYAGRFIKSYDGTATLHVGGDGEMQCRVESDDWGAELRTQGGRVEVALTPMVVFFGQALGLQVLYFHGTEPPDLDGTTRSNRFVNIALVDKQGHFELTAPSGQGILVIRDVGSDTTVTRVITGQGGGRVDLGTLAVD